MYLPFLLALEKLWAFEGEIALLTKKFGTVTKLSRQAMVGDYRHNSILDFLACY